MPGEKTEQEKPAVRSVDRALDILLCFSQKPELTLTEISRMLGLHKSTVHRLLAVLVSKNFLVKEESQDRYRLGTSIWELAYAAAPHQEWTEMLLPEMRKLRDEVKETISLYIKSGLERIRIQAVQSQQEVRRVVQVGDRFPLYGGASSKVLLAYSTPEEQEAVFRHPHWPPELSVEKLKQELQEVRDKGYAVSYGERESEVAAVAAPVYKNSEVIAALAISGPMQRFTPEKIPFFAQKLKATAETASRMLRFIP